jgi:hypothetical protein
VTENYGNWPDMINALLTAARSRRIPKQTNGLLDYADGRNNACAASRAAFFVADFEVRS